MQTSVSQLSSLFDQGFVIVFCIKGRTSLHDWVGVPSNGDKTSECKTPVESKYQRSRNETVARVNRGFCDDTNANKSEAISAEGQ